MAVRLEKHDSIGHILLDRPPANSYDKAFMEELDAAIDDAASDDGVKAILLRSASEKFFSAGADVSVFAKSGLEEQVAFVSRANDAMGKFESTPKVVVAAINGHCLGGGLEMALCCDFRVASEGSYRIGLPEVTLGLLPGTGGTQRLPRMIGLTRALSLILESKRLTPRRARKYGVIDDVVHPAILESAARSILKCICRSTGSTSPCTTAFAPPVVFPSAGGGAWLRPSANRFPSRRSPLDPERLPDHGHGGAPRPG